jgi:hypothetical protein
VTTSGPYIQILNYYPGTIPFDSNFSGDWLNTQLGQNIPVPSNLGETLSTSPVSGVVAFLYPGRVYSASVSFSPPTNQTGQIVNPGSPTYVSLGSNVFQETISDTGGTSTYNDLTLTNTVKADNPIAIDFSGVTSGSSVTIVSNAPVALTGDIQHAADDTSITADGDITNTAVTSRSQGPDPHRHGRKHRQQCPAAERGALAERVADGHG